VTTFYEFIVFDGFVKDPEPRHCKERSDDQSNEINKIKAIRLLRDPGSRIFKRFWIPAFAGMTE
jgi:hypothetical protein